MMFDDDGGDGGADVGVNVAKLIWGGWVSNIFNYPLFDPNAAGGC